MDGYERARYQSWWRERNLRESLQQKVHKEVSEELAKKRKQDGDSKKRGGFLHSMTSAFRKS